MGLKHHPESKHSYVQMTLSMLHLDLFNNYTAKHKKLLAQEVCRGGTPYICPDGRKLYSL